MTEANLKKFFNYQLVDNRNVSNEKSGSHCQNSDVDEYNSDWGKMRLQMRLQITNVFALLIISMPLRSTIMLTKNLSYLMIVMITMMTISSLLLSRSILTGTILITSMTICA